MPHTSMVEFIKKREASDGLTELESAILQHLALNEDATIKQLTEALPWIEPGIRQGLAALAVAHFIKHTEVLCERGRCVLIELGSGLTYELDKG